MFENRTQAGQLLAKQLQHLKNKNAVVLAIPRGGLPVGAEIANSLNLPLEVALSKKIGHPFNKEFAIGAVSLENEMIIADAGVSARYLEDEIKSIRSVLQQRHKQYYANKKEYSLKDKVVIITDDGIATGNTLLLTIDLVKQKLPRAIILAIPVGPPQSVEALYEHPYVTDLICLETPFNFRAVGQFYEDFEPVSDKEAISIFNQFKDKSYENTRK